MKDKIEKQTPVEYLGGKIYELYTHDITLLEVQKKQQKQIFWLRIFVAMAFGHALGEAIYSICKLLGV